MEKIQCNNESNLINETTKNIVNKKKLIKEK